MVAFACCASSQPAADPTTNARAILECTADAAAQTHRAHAWLIDGRANELRMGGADQALLLAFRTGVVEGWEVRKATLLLHLAGGLPPARLEVSAFPVPWSEISIETADAQGRDARVVPLSAMEQDWFRADIPPALVQSLVDRKAHGLMLREPAPARARRFHARESRQFAPYLIVEGVPK